MREALEHQTATSEVLGIISRSPTDVQPVLDAIVESAARVCGIDDVVLRLRDGNNMVSRAHFGPISDPGASEMSVDEPAVSLDTRARHASHSRRRAQQNDFPDVGSVSGLRALIWAFPFVSKENLLETLSARRIEVRPFTPAQIKLLETFADQAVIAIENVRLFQELKEVVGTADGDERNLGCHRQLADGYSAGAGYHRGKRRAAVRCERRVDSSRRWRHSSSGGPLRIDPDFTAGRICRLPWFGRGPGGHRPTNDPHS